MSTEKSSPEKSRYMGRADEHLSNFVPDTGPDAVAQFLEMFDPFDPADNNAIPVIE